MQSQKQQYRIRKNKNEIIEYGHVVTHNDIEVCII